MLKFKVYITQCASIIIQSLDAEAAEHEARVLWKESTKPFEVYEPHAEAYPILIEPLKSCPKSS